MSDIKIHRGYHQAIISPLTITGERWMRRKLGTTLHRIHVDYVEDFIEDLEKAELTYDIRT